MMKDGNLFSSMTARGVAALLLLLAVLVSLPFWASSYVLTVATTVMFLALIGQSWNLMLGFAGLLSIGHALFVGLAGYTSGLLFSKYGVPAIVGLIPGVAVAVAIAALIGYLGFRFSIAGVYFALLTIAFAELFRIVIDNTAFLGGAQGLYLPVTEDGRKGVNLLTLRGDPIMFYYLAMALAAAALVTCRMLLQSRLGYYWQAIRDDQEAAQALGINVFRYKMYAVSIAAAMAGVGGVFYAFYQNGLYPDSTFSVERSIEFTLGPIVGGVGTLFGPIAGALLLTPLGEFITEAIGWLKAARVIDPALKLNGVKLFIWGIVVVIIVMFKPAGIWPWIRDTLGLVKKPGREEDGQ
ncbi:MAG: branched-chain amino acid ABC transporter permease [Beijerinckiaceae bacterium]